MNSGRRDTHRLRNLIASVALMIGFIGVASWLVDRPFIVSHVLSLVNMKSAWKVEAEFIDIDFVTMSVSARDIRAEHRKEQRRLSIQNLKVGLNPFGLLKGEILFDEFDISGLSASFPKREIKKKKQPGKINLARIILLKNIALDEGIIRQMDIKVGDEFEISTDEARLSISSDLFSRTNIKLRVDGALAEKSGERIAGSGTVLLDASTNFGKWGDEFPYVNDLSGKLRISDARMSGLDMREFSAKAEYKSDLLILKDLFIKTGEHPLSGRLSADLSSEEFNLSIGIKNPIYLPYIAKPSITFDTGGKVWGEIELEGTGFLPSKSEGKGNVDISYLFDANPESPVNLKSALDWKNGMLHLVNAALTTEGVHIPASGFVDIPGKKISFSAKGENFPIENFFKTFNDPRLKKIFGRTDFSGTFEGWGKKFQADVKGTAKNAGWFPITTEIANAHFTATYDRLALVGEVFDSLGKTGNADLVIDMGEKLPSGIRSKKISLKASLKNHTLDNSFEFMNLTGAGDGSIDLSGTHESVTAKASGAIRGGSIKGIKFESASLDADISKKKAVFKNIQIAAFRSKSASAGEVIADISPDGTRFHGTPTPGITIDASYANNSHRWNIKEISIEADASEEDDLGPTRATMNGYITPEGPIDLRVKGVLDLTYTRPALPMLRSGSGEVGLDLHFTGQSENPAIKGSIDLNGNSLMFRNFPLSMENLTGSFVFEGQKINMKDVKSRSDEGQMSFNGWIEHKNMRESAVDLSVSGNAMRFRNSENNLSLEFEGSLELKGKFPSPHLSGDISIIDGIYAKDFNILDQFIKDKSDNKKSYAQEVSYEINPSLDLRVKNSGDFEIKNNVGRIWLRFDAEVKGSLQKPVVSGAISASEGEIYYLGLLFDVDKGFVEFRGNYQEPYIEVHASKEVSIYNISLALYGNTDNLRLDLSATSPSGPLEKRDVVSLIMFGITEQEREMYARERSGDYTSSLLAKSLSSVVERPFTKYTRLDVFRLEAADPNSNSISRLYVGKQLSDRLGINFSTDIGTNESEQTIIAEYLLTDHLLLRGSQSTDNVSEISGLLRFRMR